MTDERKHDADVLIIGGGPGGYTCALKLASLGRSVILIEKDKIGGTCLNRGCIPTKALLQSAELFVKMKTSSDMGVEAKARKLDMGRINSRKQETVDFLVQGIESRLAARAVRIIKGEASFIQPGVVSIALPGGEKTELSAENIVIASGSKASAPQVPGIDGRNVITSTEALDAGSLPKSLAVIGGGVIGMEIGSAYADFGVKVTILEAMPNLLPGMDGEIVKEFTEHAKQKMDIHVSAMVRKISGAKKDKRIVFEKDGESLEIIAEKVLVATGRVPDTENLCLEKAGISTERGRVVVDEDHRTSVPGIYCIGDANGICMLAHAASAQGAAVAGLIAGQSFPLDQKVMPSCVYTDPEIAAVGLTEEQAKEKGLDYRTVKYPFRSNARAHVMGRDVGFVKIIGGNKYNEILGIHIIGPNATELIGECAMAMRLEGCIEHIAGTIHAHPTLGENIMDAAASWLDSAEF